MCAGLGNSLTKKCSLSPNFQASTSFPVTWVTLAVVSPVFALLPDLPVIS